MNVAMCPTESWMSNKFDQVSLPSILNLLADGKYHSGQELASLLGCSRTAIWKHLQKLQDLDLPLLAVKGKGYCLDGGLELLDEKSIRSLLDLQAQASLSKLDIHYTIDSTNAHALQERSNESSGYICLAEQQAAGKGRLGRRWVSPFGRNIYFSLLWNFDGGVVALEGLSLAVGVAVAEALNSCGVEDVKLKWPNDVLWRQRKLAGILLEVVGDPSGSCQVVVGIGINVSMPVHQDFTIDQPWVDVREIMAETNPSATVSRNALVAALINRLLPLMLKYPAERFAPYHSQWQRLNAYANQNVSLQTASKITYGLVLGVDSTGALRVRTEKGEQLFHGGEISLRAMS